MRHTSRILGGLLAAVLSVGPPSQDIPKSPAAVGQLTGIGQSADEHAAIVWAIDRFENGGLEVPPVVVEIHRSREGCGGYGGRFHGGASPRIDICNPNRYIILHELAHAWDHHNLTDEIRQQFMEIRGLSVWNDRDVPWKHRGVEALAEIITWGLNNGQYVGDPEEKLNREQAFELITGRQVPEHQREALATRAGAQTDTPSSNPEWDVWR